MNHVTIGIYPNGEYKVNIVRPEDLENHIEYNKTWRFGRLLFVDGVCIYRSHLNESFIQKWEEKIKDMKIDSSVPSKEYH